MTNADKFEKVYGFRPNTKEQIPPLLRCWLQKCKGCKYRKTEYGCNPLEWWDETYKRPIKKESEEKQNEL